MVSYGDRVEAVVLMLSSLADSPKEFWSIVSRLRTNPGTPECLRKALCKLNDEALVRAIYRAEYPKMLESDWLELIGKLKGVRHDFRPESHL